jgi:hypothetical protein
MKLEGDYAVDKSQRMHRIASLIVYVVWIGFAFDKHGLSQAFRTAVYYFLPMGCIWFPEALGSYTSRSFSGRAIDETSHPTFLRWAGWFLLLLVPLFLLVKFGLTINDFKNSKL